MAPPATDKEMQAGATLQHTLQTWVGMVMNNGRPQDREVPDQIHEEDSPDNEGAAQPDIFGLLYKRASPQVRANINACTDVTVDLAELKRYIHHGKRLDIEQAVAMALSVLPREAAAVLYSHIAHLVTGSCMWREDHDKKLQEPVKAVSKARRLQKVCALLAHHKCGVIDDPAPGMQDGMSGLVSTLMRIRRHRPGCGNSQRLALPDALMQEAIDVLPEQNRDAWREYWRWGPQQPLQSAGDQLKVVPKLLFKKLSAALRRLDGDRSPGGLLNRDVEALAEAIECGGGRLQALEATQDSFALALSFMAWQRRRQLKVVSDMGWTTFLAKGEGAGVLQNRPDVMTSFELFLLDLALARPAGQIDWQALTAVHTPPGCEGRCIGCDEAAERLQLIDQTCLLMERYVDVHGNGELSNLTYKQGVHGGSGRGPVDTYNKLVDLLAEQKRRCKNAGLPVEVAPCHKFLAKDIMAWNDGWSDDAFADGKIPGWVGWLKNRRATGALLPRPCPSATGMVVNTAVQEPQAEEGGSRLEVMYTSS